MKIMYPISNIFGESSNNPSANNNNNNNNTNYFNSAQNYMKTLPVRGPPPRLPGTLDDHPLGNNRTPTQPELPLGMGIGKPTLDTVNVGQRGLPPLAGGVLPSGMSHNSILPPPHKTFTDPAPQKNNDIYNDKQYDNNKSYDKEDQGSSPYSDEWESRGEKSGKNKRKRTEETAEVRKERHNQAEKKRRSDMNGAIQKLKNMLPEQITKDRRLTKVDILTETADHLTQVQNLCAKLLAENKQLKAQLQPMNIRPAIQETPPPPTMIHHSPDTFRTKHFSHPQTESSDVKTEPDESTESVTNSEQVQQ
eukprot:TRINITY_DN2846_c0_g1_i2.p1 TRINITY_DN2846_c0_g1~~TRINITY_DN2846_c0_g1_i2.p1  ORF type:complete len:307 (+),score=44.40 TRINITY_DN2846_c0_g1_i2:41-961(+)